MARINIGAKKAPFILLLGLIGCVNLSSPFVVPKQIGIEQERFEKVFHSQIDEMQQLLYLPVNSARNPDDWQQGILLFLDQNSQGRTLSARAQLREQHFANQVETVAKVNLQDNQGKQELQSQVIYPPSARFNNVQLEVSRGRDLVCGYGQMQWVNKQAISEEKVQNFDNFQPLLVEMATLFSQLAWQIECR